jgi:hypothetical protein
MVSGQRNRCAPPAVFTAISFAPAGTSLVVVFPPGQRTQRRVGDSGNANTWTALSCDQ